MIELATAAGLGLALGAVTGIPLGVVNVAVIEAAGAGRRRFAIELGLGGALADAIHAAIAFVGVGRVVTERPQWMKGLAAVAAVVIVAHALLRRRDRTPREGHGVVSGIALTLPNPAALAAWVAVASAVWPTIALPAGLVVGVGVGLGSAAWFTLLARMVAALPEGGRLRRALPRAAAVVLVVIAAAGVVRAFVVS